MADVTPEGEDIEVAVQRLRTGQAVVPSGMTVEQLKAWLREATREKCPGREHWDKIVSIKRLAFREGHILEALIWETMVFISKSGGGYRGIGLV